ncbi:MAG TPA: 23S rRNA (guanosine(2251)-2'-O)-methyltransferase RlmB [Alphaproteobacteria bacterium]|nr:23S rRNA (guanosine(2251)-2'-O)-methyltransferase RlmB [Alphaproteobacteria bacterium]
MRQKTRKGREGAPARPPASGQSYWIWGQHAVLAALGNPDRLVSRLLLAQGREAAPGLPGLATRGVAPETVPGERLAALLPADCVHQGIAALVGPMPEVSLAEIAETGASPRRIVVLDQVTDPHNVGAILRSAAAFGALALVLQDRHAPPVSGTLAKAASGATELVPVVRVVNIARALEELADYGYLRLGLADEAAEDIRLMPRDRDIALVLGAEGPGLRRLTRERCDRLVRLPTQAHMPSLNVSNAGAAALFALLP